jgi:ABC-type branched-subunit amino acid transport system ATPase component
MALMHDPQLLLIDELSLGLAPLVVQELIEVVGRLRDQGMTIVIVEQSLNVALAVADRAIFLEKGRVRFEGPTRDLAERDDLARAVFLGAEGG